jgi:hypothetical protein
MLEPGPDFKSDPSTNRAIRPIYVKALIATVALLILGSPGFSRLSGVFASFPQIWWWLDVVLTWVTVALIVATLILAPIAWRRIRSQGGEASRSYGVMAILGAALGIVFALLSGIWTTIMFLYGTRWLTQYWLYSVRNVVDPSIDYTVVSMTAAWATLALTRVGRRVSGAFERIGLGLGLLWIATYVARHALDIANRLRF